jgi:hypothetical protein
MKACSVSRNVVSLTFGLDTRLRWVAQFTPPAALRLGKNPLPIEEEARWAQSRSGCVRRKSLPAGDGTPAHSVVMYRLHHPGRCYCDCMTYLICPLLFSCLSCLYHSTFPLVFLLLLSRCIPLSRSLYVLSFFFVCCIFILSLQLIFSCLSLFTFAFLSILFSSL